MSRTPVSLPQRGFGQTARKDLWWIQPVVVFLGLSAFIVYSTWAAFQAAHYHHGPYLSPFYSPELFGESAHAWFGPKPGWYPTWLPWSPAFFILWAPAGFRLTCYYYRGAYYKAFWADPPSCGVGEPRKCYRGENSFPLIIQNIHRYFFYVAMIFIVLLAIDAWNALWFDEHWHGRALMGDGGVGFGIGIGTLVLTINVILLASYTLGCHSLRHLIGGSRNVLATAPLGKKTYDCVSCLNRRHMLYAWMSLFWVGFSDVYVRLCSMGVWTDWRII